MAARHGHSKVRMQDTDSREQPGARRSLLSRTQLHHVSKIFTFLHSSSVICSSLSSAVVLSDGTLCPGAEQQEEEEEVLGAGHGNVYVCSFLRRSKSRITCNKQRSPFSSSRLILHRRRAGSEQPHRRLGARAVWRLRLRGQAAGWESLRCPLAGTELCIAPSVQLDGSERRVHVDHKSSLLSFLHAVMETGGAGRARAPTNLQFVNPLLNILNKNMSLILCLHQQKFTNIHTKTHNFNILYSLPAKSAADY